MAQNTYTVHYIAREGFETSADHKIKQYRVENTAELSRSVRGEWQRGWAVGSIFQVVECDFAFNEMNAKRDINFFA